MLLDMTIGMTLFVLSVTLKVVLVKEFFLTLIVTCLCLVGVILIGQHALLLVIL